MRQMAFLKIAIHLKINIMNSFPGNFKVMTNGRSLSEMFSQFIRVITTVIVMDFDAGHSPAFVFVTLKNKRPIR
jgi:hypothetical protein